MLLADRLLMGGNMEIAFIAAASQQNTSSGSTLVINKPAGTVNGDLMIAFVSGSSSSCTWTGDTGWTELVDQGAKPDLRVAWKIAASEGASYTFTANASMLLTGSILTYRNAAFDVVGAVATSGNPLVVSGITVSVANSRLIGFAIDAAASVTVGAPGSMTVKAQDNDASQSSYVIADEPVNGGATGTRSFSMANATNVQGVLLSIKPG